MVDPFFHLGSPSGIFLALVSTEKIEAEELSQILQM